MGKSTNLFFLKGPVKILLVNLPLYFTKVV